MNALQPAGPTSPVPTVTGHMDIVRAALATGNIEMYREAVLLMKEMDAFAAEKAFNNALADAKAELPLIRKNRHVSFGEGKNATSYDHEDLAEVVDTVTPILSRHGLSHRWRLRGKPGEPITIWCLISHRAGHKEENEISFGADTTGGKNAIQAVKSAISYGERITLMASLGLASRKDDDDGRGTSTDPEPVAYTPPDGSLSPTQIDELRDLMASLNVSSKAFLQWAKVARIEAIPETHFLACIAAIRKVGGKQQ